MNRTDSPAQLKDALRAVRQNLRAQLHKLMSYAELVSETEVGLADEQFSNGILTLRTLCEGMLQEIQGYFETLTVLDSQVLDNVRNQLLPQCPKLHSVIQSLDALVVRADALSLKKDIDKISSAATLFEETLHGLALPSIKRQETSDHSGKGQNTLSTPARRDPMIVQVEYKGLLLVVDDEEDNRDVLSRRLLRDGYEVMFAESGKHALRILKRYSFDLVLLDIMMPEMDGTEVLAAMKKQPEFSRLPVIMITAVDDIETIAHCIQAGADDYLLKPFNPVLLRARITALLERKRYQDEQQRKQHELEVILEENKRQKDKTEQLLLNILPGFVADELQEFDRVQPMYFEDVTIVFSDIVGFTLSTEQLPVDELVEVLNDHFTACDKIVARYGLEKLKTIGDCYMFAGGIPVRNPSHPVDSVLAALEMIHTMKELTIKSKVDWELRIGIHSGPVIAGVVGIHKFAFDIWGDSVNRASRMESSGAPGRINLSGETFARVKDFFACEKRGRIAIKEGKEVEMFFVSGIVKGLLDKPGMTPLEAFGARYKTYFRKPLVVYPEYIFKAAAVPPQEEERRLP